MDLLGGVLLYLGLTSAVFGVASLVWPLRFVGIRTRKAAPIVLLLGFFVFTAAVFLPSGETRVATVRSQLDAFAPVFQFSEVHSILVGAPKNRIYTAIRQVTPDEIRFFKPLMWIRSFNSPPGSRPILDSFLSGEYVLLADDADREIVFGRARYAGKPLTPGQFATFRQAPFLKIVVSFRIAEVDPTHCMVTTETRVYAIGGDMLRGFSAYWRMIHPGSALIRRSWLRAIKSRAETASAI